MPNIFKGSRVKGTQNGSFGYDCKAKALSGPYYRGSSDYFCDLDVHSYQGGLLLVCSSINGDNSRVLVLTSILVSPNSLVS